MKRLSRFAKAWRELAAHIGDFQARLLLTVFYWSVAAPFGLIARLIDPLRTRPTQGHSGWLPRERRPADALESARRQF